MTIQTTPIDDLLIVHPKVFEDKRGYFFESYNQDEFNKNGIHYHWMQDNQSKSTYGVIRGLHFQLPPHAQAKLVRVLNGKILDVAVDIRQKSPSFGKWFGVEISSENKFQLLIPEGFAHGFSVLSETAIVLYKCNQLYDPELEKGIHYNDPALKIDWKIPATQTIVSPKDQDLPNLNKIEMNFLY